MIPYDDERPAPVTPPERDAVDALADEPTVVSVSDVHGYLGDARSALKTVGEHPDFAPVVRTDGDGRLHWAGGDDYVLVFNGDLVDRGPDNQGVVDLVGRLRAEAPPGHVRVTFGNHEMGVLAQDLFRWGRWYSASLDDAARRTLCRDIADGHVVAAYAGYNVVYAHAGRPEAYDVAALNESLVDAAERMEAAIGTDEDAAVQEALVADYPDVLGLGGGGGRGPGAGVAWLDFRHMPEDAPPQVVGHTRQKTPVRKGSVVCQNVIRKNSASPGGEAVLVETPDRLVSLERTYDGEVHENEFDLAALTG